MRIGLQQSKICMKLKVHHCSLLYSTKLPKSEIFTKFRDGSSITKIVLCEIGQ